MRYNIFSLILLCALCTLSSCGSDDEKDVTYPVISSQGIVANPVECQQYRRGDVIPFNYLFTDDQELGSFNIEVHNNFDHHTHSGSATECPMDEKKDAVNPWIYNQDYTIPSGLQSYNAKFDIPIPSDIDTGDYHFMIRLTDHAGWQQHHSVSIKIIE